MKRGVYSTRELRDQLSRLVRRFYLSGEARKDGTLTLAAERLCDVSGELRAARAAVTAAKQARKSRAPAGAAS